MYDYPRYHSSNYSALDLVLSPSSHYPSLLADPSYASQQPYSPPSYPTYPSYSHLHSHSPARPRRHHHRSPARHNRSVGRVTAAPPTQVTVQERVREDLVKGTSQIEYVPVQKKVIDFIEEERYEIVPKKRTITEYKDFVRVDYVPREVTETDYYAVEHVRYYVPQVIPEKEIEYVPVEKKNVRYEYIPVERQIVHYPEQQHEEQQTRYLGVREQAGPKTYVNLREEDIQYWEREYGYVRGEPLTELNRKIREKVERDKERYFARYERMEGVQHEHYPSRYTRASTLWDGDEGYYRSRYASKYRSSSKLSR